MAWCPFAVHRPLPENSQQGRITPRAVILHTAVDSASPNSSIYGFFARGDVTVESHFYVMDNGTIEQYIDTGVRGDANRDANSFAISIETEDDGAPAQNAWTAAQVNAIVRLVAWCCDLHGIPKRQIGDPYGSGIGWHAMWGAPSAWTPSAGKTCPGAPRINQSRNVIIPRVAGGQVEDELSWTDDLTGTFDGKTSTFDAGVWLMYANHYAGKAATSAATAVTRAASVEAKIDALRANIGDVVRQAVQDYLTNNPPTVSVDVEAIAKAVLDEDHRRSAA